MKFPQSFQRIARFAPLVGLLMGALLAGVDRGLTLVHFPLFSRTAGIVILWLGMTGGLHLDGAMDTADGLAVRDPQRRLVVMADSRAGAFGVMAACAILLLKFSALVDLGGMNLGGVDRGMALVTAAAWGRMGQVWAIEHYPYLKPEGKGAFHKEFFQSPWDSLMAFTMLLLWIGGQIVWNPDRLGKILIGHLGGGAIAWSTAAWFNAQLGGHTGDTYGAVVEWTEALLLGLLAAIG